MNELAVESIVDAATIQSEVRALAARLGEEFAGRDFLIISVLTGSVIFVADLVRAFDRPVRFEFIQVETTEEDDGPAEMYFPIPVDVTGQIVLLIKDIVASGVIETYLGEQLVQCGAKEVRIIALVDVVKERKTSFEPDYSLFNLERRGTLVGYGLKKQGEGGNLPYLGWVLADA